MKTREEYLVAYTRELSKLFKQVGVTLNLKKIKVSCGFPSKGGQRSKNKTIGQCFNDALNGFNEIFIHPMLDDVIKVGGVLAHELIHASDNCKSGHRGHFRKTAIAIGLEGQMTATTEGEELQAKLKKITKKLGKYPHRSLDYTDRKKQGTRMIKVECAEHSYIARLSRTAIENEGEPVCPSCLKNELYTISDELGLSGNDIHMLISETKMSQDGGISKEIDKIKRASA
tara:strand:- start:951 stop:1637 length:687 start_codon:yes stop_codon:yes gene_type:complete